MIFIMCDGQKTYKNKRISKQYSIYKYLII